MLLLLTKKTILKGLKQKETVAGIIEISKALDVDLKNNSTQNQDRIKNVIQYIKDNQLAFQF